MLAAAFFMLHCCWCHDAVQQMLSEIQLADIFYCMRDIVHCACELGLEIVCGACLAFNLLVAVAYIDMKTDEHAATHRYKTTATTATAAAAAAAAAATAASTTTTTAAAAMTTIHLLYCVVAAQAV
eukprot:2507-Heterococcus_DN1.PRE.5